MGVLFKIVFTNGRVPSLLERTAFSDEYLNEAAAFAYSLQPLLAACVIDGTCTCYYTVGICIHMLLYVRMQLHGVCVCVCVCVCVPVGAEAELVGQ